MRITVVGATGGIGRLVVDQAIEAGHTVTAAVRTPNNLHRAVHAAVTVDLTQIENAELCRAVDGADAVISCLGPRNRQDYGIVAPGTASLLGAMAAVGASRVLAVSGAGVSTAPTPTRPDPPKREPGAGWYNQFFATPLARRVLGSHFVDVAIMEDHLRASGLTWTSVRPPYLTDGPLTGSYRTAVERNVQRGKSISRADVAHFMLAAVDDPMTYLKAISVAH